MPACVGADTDVRESMEGTVYASMHDAPPLGTWRRQRAQHHLLARGHVAPQHHTPACTLPESLGVLCLRSLRVARKLLAVQHLVDGREAVLCRQLLLLQGLELDVARVGGVHPEPLQALNLALQPGVLRLQVALVVEDLLAVRNPERRRERGALARATRREAPPRRAARLPRNTAPSTAS